MKIALKCLLIVAFIFSFFFFLSKPANASLVSDMEAWMPASSFSSSSHLASNISGIVYSACQYKFGTNGQCDGHKWTAFIRPETFNYYQSEPLVDAVFIYFTDNYSLTSATYNSKNYIMTTVAPDLIWLAKTPNNRGCSGIGGSPSWNVDRQNMNTCKLLSPSFEISKIGHSNRDIIKTSNWTNNLSLDYGGLGTSINYVTPYTFMKANYDDNWHEVGYIAPPTPTFTYFIEYRDNFVTNSWLRLESSKPAYISSSWAVGANLFGFDGGDWQLYETDGTQRALLDSSSSYYPPYLYIADHNNPCGSLGRSNYSLRDDNGDFLCPATNNSVVDDIAPPFEGKINFVIEDHDWGVFDWLRVPAKILFDAIDGTLVWFNGLWRGLLSQLIPMPDFLAFAFQEIKQVADEKFSQIDLSSLEDFGELEEDTMPNITTSLMGVSVTVVNFDLIKPHIGLLRAIMISTVSFFLILFNINQVNKLLSDNSVTE